MKSRIRKHDQEGSIIVSILAVTIFLTIIVYALIVLANVNLTRAKGRILALQTQYAAESGADSAIAQLNNGNESYTGTGSEVTVIDHVQYKATYTVSVASGSSPKEKIITAVGRLYSPKSATSATYIRRIEVTAQRSGSTTTSGIVSRNIFETASSVKDLKTVDIFVNNFITMNKNTTVLIAENITVGDKNTGASSCSIGGTGNLEKPSSFTHAGQTKTQIKTAYNNCITPPGNTSNSDFDVAANQTDISKIQSSYIPFSQYMDNSYSNAPGGCSDWTTGSFPRDIPSTGNTKKTHYPDDDNGVTSSCGVLGDLTLGNGQYNINDHAHIRANLCATSACTPTFYNPDSGSAGIKFIFVEGNVNFDKLTTASGSGPIVLVVYGSDPASKAHACPLGGAFYLGNSGETVAPAIYILANNGVCLSQTKFGADPALGGMSGKNIYIATNSGTPFDLRLDSTFPVDQIPVDLAWRAIRYRRL